MTQLAYSIFTAHQPNPANDVMQQVIELFELFPGVTAFTVGKYEDQETEASEQALAVRNVTFGENVRKDDEGDVRHRIRELLAQFVQGRPEMLDLLSGRTFSRKLHQLLDTRALAAQQRNS